VGTFFSDAMEEGRRRQRREAREKEEMKKR